MWRLVKMSSIATALQRGAAEWWHCPRSKRPVLRSRAGLLYDFKQLPRFGWGLRKRERETIP